MTVSSNSTQRLLAQLKSANAIVESLGVWRDPVNQQLHLQENPVEIARKLASGLVGRLKLASALIWFFDAEDKALHLQANAGLVSPALAQISQLLPDDSPIGALVRSRSPKLSNNLKDEPWIQSPHWIEAEHLVGFAGYPITLGTELMGCVAVFSHHTLEPEFLEVLQFICTHTASAIATARQAHQLRLQAQQDALLREVGEKLRRAVGVADLLQETVDALGESFNCDRARVLTKLEGSKDESLNFTPQAFASDRVKSMPVAPRALTDLVNRYCPDVNNRAIIQTDLLELEDEGLPLRHQLAAAGYRTIAIVPIVLQEANRDRVLAQLLLGWGETRVLDSPPTRLLGHDCCPSCGGPQ